VNLASKQLCSGCTACYAVCPVFAIAMREDHEGFKSPEIDSKRCTDCGRCEQVCPVLHPRAAREPLAVYAAKNKDENVRSQSSSGGIFTLLAQHVLKEKGVVFGAGWSPDWRVVHKAVETDRGLADLRGSKYVQSDMKDIFKQVKKVLDLKQKVLFTGTPCQVAGLWNYLCDSITKNHPYNECLLLVDMICMAVSSPKVFNLFLQEKTHQYNKSLKQISFRSKKNGWAKKTFVLNFADNQEYVECGDTENFCKGFAQSLFNRPACFNCSCRQLKSGADITIADYWNVHKKFPALDDGRGISLVMANTPLGSRIAGHILPLCDYVASNFDDVKKNNPAVLKSFGQHPNRRLFFQHMESENVESLIREMLKPSLYRRLRNKVGRIKCKILGKIK